MTMGQGFETPVITLPQSGGFSPYLRVVLSGGTLALAGATDREIGTIALPVPATGVGSGTTAAVLTNGSEGPPYMVANGAISQFASVYGAAGGKVSATPNGNFIGIALTATANDGEWVIVLRTKGGQQYLFSNVAASTALTGIAANTATIFDQNYTLPANLLKAGDLLKIVAQVIMTAVHSTDTQQFNLKIGSTVLIGDVAANPTTNDIFLAEFTLQVRTAGATGTCVGTGLVTRGTPGTATATPGILASTTLNTTIAQQIGVWDTCSVLNGGNSARLDVLTIERIAS